MHDAYIRISRLALAATLVWLAAPALAQTPAELPALHEPRRGCLREF